MRSDNPFAPGTGSDDFGRNEGGTLEPVAMDVGPILQRCWDLALAHPGTVLGAIVIPAVVSGAFSAVTQVLDASATRFEDTDPGLAAGLYLMLTGAALFSMAINLFLQLGAVRIYSRLTRGLPADVGMLFGEARFFLPGALATLFATLAVLTGLLLFVIPGLILAIGLQFVLYAMVDQGLGPIEALQESWRLADGQKLTIFGVNLVLGIGMLLFACGTCGMGVIVAAPVLALTQGVMYHSLLHLQGPRPQFV